MATAKADVTAGSFLVSKVTKEGEQQVGLLPFFFERVHTADDIFGEFCLTMAKNGRRSIRIELEISHGGNDAGADQSFMRRFQHLRVIETNKDRCLLRERMLIF